MVEQEEHLFARYIKILARGKTKSRPFTEEEAETAMDMVMAGDVRGEQLGAFLMLLRFKEETPEEVAGFVRSVRSSLQTYSRFRHFAGGTGRWWSFQRFSAPAAGASGAEPLPCSS